ncbi:hypothetical protein [Ralstonia pseudosolanacearum]|uniref:Transmembrane protein n=1 Tax=Ralstonia solanacearum TaxID=305 RepID=A0AA92ICP5_RALSL|nr:hypothetical protein [Ralstonia pseudosolanacearum]QCX47761.1 hypothetical protein E7Z57_00720 [Ralstonia pseudosolanacearum]
MTRTRIVRWVDALTGLLVAMSAAFTAYVRYVAHIDLAAVRTGPIVAIGGALMILGTLLVLLELPLVLFVLVQRPGRRLRVTATMMLGLVLFVACIAVTEKYTESKLPPRQSTTLAPAG